MTDKDPQERHSTSDDTASRERRERSGPQPDTEAIEYHYRSAGIRERSGGVPLWLVMVAVALLIWGLYYGVTYWSAP